MSFLPYVQAAGQIAGALGGSSAGAPKLSSATAAAPVTVGGLNVGFPPPGLPGPVVPVAAPDHGPSDGLLQGVAVGVAVAVILSALGLAK